MAKNSAAQYEVVVVDDEDVRMTRIQYQRGSILGVLEEKEIDKIGQEGRSVCHPSGSCFRSPSYGFGGKTHGTFFVLYNC